MFNGTLGIISSFFFSSVRGDEERERGCRVLCVSVFMEKCRSLHRCAFICSDPATSSFSIMRTEHYAKGILSLIAAGHLVNYVLCEETCH